MNKVLVDREVVAQVVDALECVSFVLVNSVPIREAATALRAALEHPVHDSDAECLVKKAKSSVDYWQRRGYLGDPEEWRESCRLFRVRSSPEDCERMAKLRAYIEDGLLIVTTPTVTAPQPAQQPEARTAAIQACIDRLEQGGKPAEAGMLRHHFAKDLGEE